MSTAGEQTAGTAGINDGEDIPSGWALDRATALVHQHVSSRLAPSALVEEVAKLIDRAESAGDPAEVTAAQERRRLRSTAQSIIDGCTNQGRGVDGRSYWTLTERVVKFLAEEDRLRAELHRTAQQGGGEIDTLRARLEEALATIDAQQATMRELEAQRDVAQQDRARLFHELEAQRDDYESARADAATLADERDELQRRLAETANGRKVEDREEERPNGLWND